MCTPDSIASASAASAVSATWWRSARPSTSSAEAITTPVKPHSARSTCCSSRESACSGMPSFATAAGSTSAAPARTADSLAGSTVVRSARSDQPWSTPRTACPAVPPTSGTAAASVPPPAARRAAALQPVDVGAHQLGREHGIAAEAARDVGPSGPAPAPEPRTGPRWRGPRPRRAAPAVAAASSATRSVSQVAALASAGGSAGRSVGSCSATASAGIGRRAVARMRVCASARSRAIAVNGRGPTSTTPGAGPSTGPRHAAGAEHHPGELTDLLLDAHLGHQLGDEPVSRGRRAQRAAPRSG